jgi:DNA-binding LacI/PurR family transcriptional regulator
MDADKQPTMQQIADVVGCSRMAVSLALRNSPKISAPMIARIHKVADELGYRPNPMVSALMTQLRHGRTVKRPTTIAYVTAYPTEDGWRQPGLFTEFHTGAEKRAEALGYKLEEYWLRRPGLSEKRFCDVLFARNVLGLVIAPLPSGGGTLGLDWPRFATAAIGYSVTSPSIHRASNDQYSTIRLAIAELTRLGYRRIGLALTRDGDERVKNNWSAGMLVEQSMIPADRRIPVLLADGPFDEAFSTWFSHHRPDVVLTQSWQCRRVLKDLGLRVPEDVGLASLGVAEGEADWAGANQNAELVGAAALDLVDAQLRRNEYGIPVQQKTLLIPGHWVAGPTVRDVTLTARRRGH